MTRRKRDIIGISFEIAIPCPACTKMTTVFERVDVEGKVVLICSACMDKVMDEVIRRWKEERVKEDQGD